MAHYLASDRTALFQSDNQSYLVKQLAMPVVNTEWQVVLMLPMQSALATEQAMRTDLIRRNTENVVLLLLVSGVVLFISLWIAFRYVRQREFALNRSRNQLAMVFNTAPSPMAVARCHQGQCVTTRINQTWLREFGFSEQQVLGSNGELLGWWCSDEDRRRVIDQIMDEGQLEQFQVWMQRADRKSVV